MRARPLEDPELDSFMRDLREGLNVQSFLLRLNSILGHTRAAGMVEYYRLAKGPLKKLRDEIVPTKRLIASLKLQGTISLIDSQEVDILVDQADLRRSIQCTVAGARARNESMKLLNEKGIARGFFGLRDEAPQAEFDAAASEDLMYTTEKAQSDISRWIFDALRKKAPKTGAHTLLIETCLLALPEVRWREIIPTLSEEASQIGFPEVYLVAWDGEQGDHCVRLK